jgi:hypothetical protein
VSPAERRRLLGLSELGAEPSSGAGTDELEGGARRAS